MAKQPTRKKKAAKSLTMPKRKAAPSKPTRKKAEAVVKVDPRRTARKTFAGERVKHFIDVAAVTPNLTQAVQASEGAVSLPQANQLAAQPDVVSAILNKRKTLAEECGITSERIMREYAALGFSNMLDYVATSESGEVRVDLGSLTREQAAAIQEITVEEYMDRVPGGDEDELERVKRTKFKLYPKEVALDKMAKHLGIKGFSNSLTAKVGAKIQQNADGTFEAAVVVELGDDELERIAAGVEDVSDEQRTE